MNPGRSLYSMCNLISPLRRSTIKNELRRVLFHPVHFQIKELEGLENCARNEKRNVLWLYSSFKKNRQEKREYVRDEFYICFLRSFRIMYAPPFAGAWIFVYLKEGRLFNTFRVLKSDLVKKQYLSQVPVWVLGLAFGLFRFRFNIPFHGMCMF